MCYYDAYYGRMVRWETQGTEGVEIPHRQQVDERHRQNRRRVATNSAAGKANK